MTLVVGARWAVAGVLALFWLGASVTNLVDLVRAGIHRTSTSLILFFGGIAGVVAMLACPIPGTNQWAWVPAVLDLGCVPAGLIMLFAVVTGKFKDSGDEGATGDMARLYHDAIREVLLREWDPIGVGDVREAQDEYDSYVAGVHERLVGRSSEEELFAHLWEIETGHMGLAGDRRHTEAIAKRLVGLRGEIEGGTSRIP
ncbi:hypothetical protein ACFL2T_06700 [Elusimicrobiota bacterium]